MPHLKINRKLEPLVVKPKPIKVGIGGRGSGKSIGFGDIFTMKMATERADIYCLREYQDSIVDSVHRVFRDSIQKRLQLKGWDVQENKVVAPNGAVTTYRGAARNPDSIQSAQNYKYSWFEEAHRASKSSLDKLLPTILRNPGAECWFSANPQSSGDPFSQRFIVPYLKELERDGYYEDEVHLIVVINWRDNPWWNEEQERLRSWDFNNRPRAEYDWMWEGKFHDSIESALIQPEWFDACIDAHKKLGWEPKGAVVATYDPADVGADAQGFSLRHGNVFIDVSEIQAVNANRGVDAACGLAIKGGADVFGWDCDGLGAPLRDQVARNFQGKNIRSFMFKGSEGPHNPDAVFSASDKYGFRDSKKNKDVFANKRAQNYAGLAERCRKTWEAVTAREEGNHLYIDQDELVSFSGEIKALDALRSELCRLPLKPNGAGRILLYTKAEMRSGITLPGGNRVTIPSPNMGDCCMMSFDSAATPAIRAGAHIPRPVPAMGRR
jgi:phage terminase large subunit